MNLHTWSVITDPLRMTKRFSPSLPWVEKQRLSWPENYSAEETLLSTIVHCTSSIRSLRKTDTDTLNRTSILHAIPVMQSGVSRAVEAARMALKSGPDMSRYEDENEYFWVLYCHWVTLNVPLTPFTVLFCHIIANIKDCEKDLKLLERFVRSMHRSRGVSDGTEKLYQLCSVFWNVAKAYVQVKNQEVSGVYGSGSGMLIGTNQANAQPVTGDFDEYLSALGLAPQPVQTTSTDLTAPGFQLEEDMSNYLQDWWSGNGNLYGLLDQDLGNINGLGLEGYAMQTL